TSPPTSRLYTLSLHDALPISQHPLHCRPNLSLHVVSMRLGPIHLQVSFDGLYDVMNQVTQELDAVCLVVMNGDSVVECELLLVRSEEHTSELQSRSDLVCRLL